MRACMLSCLSHVQLFATLWTVAHQATLSMGFTSQEYWSELPCPPPGDLPDQGSNPRLLCPLHWQVDSLLLVPPGKPMDVSMSQSSSLSSLYPHWISFTNNQRNFRLCCKHSGWWDSTREGYLPTFPSYVPFVCFCMDLLAHEHKTVKKNKYICLTLCQTFSWTTHTHTHRHTHTLHIISDFELLYHLYRREIWVWKDMPKITELCKWHTLSLDTGLLKAK